MDISQNKLKNINFEFLFVDDGSNDGTLSVIKNLVRKDKRVKYISFSRNFGKEAAMNAGLSYAKGDYVALMDADILRPHLQRVMIFMCILFDSRINENVTFGSVE